MNVLKDIYKNGLNFLMNGILCVIWTVVLFKHDCIYLINYITLIIDLIYITVQIYS